MEHFFIPAEANGKTPAEEEIVVQSSGDVFLAVGGNIILAFLLYRRLQRLAQYSADGHFLFPLHEKCFFPAIRQTHCAAGVKIAGAYFVGNISVFFAARAADQGGEARQEKYVSHNGCFYTVEHSDAR